MAVSVSWSFCNKNFHCFRKRKQLAEESSPCFSVLRWFKPLDRRTMSAWRMDPLPYHHLRLPRKCKLTLYPQIPLDPSSCTSAVCSMTLAMILKVVTMLGKSSICVQLMQWTPLYIFPLFCLVSDDNACSTEELAHQSGRTSRTIRSLTSRPITHQHTMKTCSVQCSACAHWAGHHGVPG